MAGLVVFRPGVDWTATGGLFDWMIEFLVERISDHEAIDRLREILDNNLGALWIGEFPPDTRLEIIALLRDQLVGAAERDLPQTAYKQDALRHLQELTDLTLTTDDSA